MKHQPFAEPKLHSAYLGHFLLGLGLLWLSLLINHQANLYAARMAGPTVGDLLLAYLPTVDVSWIYSYGAYLFGLIVVAAGVTQPSRAPYLLKSIALFITVRAGFMVLTHLGPPPGMTMASVPFPSYLSSGSDYFFSGHTGLPFLLALLFWDRPGWRALFLSATLIGATAVLLGHIHYSIDVVAGLFITHGIFLIGRRLFDQTPR